MWVFDNVLDAYDRSTEEGRETLFIAIQKWLAAQSMIKKVLPPHANEDDFKTETFFALDKIALSDKPREKKISNMFALSRFLYCPQFSKLNCIETVKWLVSYWDDGYEDSEWETNEKGIDKWALKELEWEECRVSESEMLFYSLWKRWEITELEYNVMHELQEPYITWEEVGKRLWITKNRVYVIRRRMKYIIKAMKILNKI